MINSLHDGSLYLPTDPEIQKIQNHYLDQLYDFNHTRPSQLAKRQEMLKNMLADIGKDCYIEPPFNSNWGGHHVHFGDNIYVNFNFTATDDTHIYVGSNTQIGPNVSLVTAGHPVLPELRKQGYQYNMPVHIGENCWLGAGVIVLPGVTIGANTVIGAGSIVTKDIPANVVAVGDPCRVMRPVSEHDHEYYFKNHKIDWSKI